MENNKTTCIFFKSLYDAARELKETDPMTALEIYSSFFDYAFGTTDKVETDSQIARLLVMQNIPSLNAATNRYNAAVENGKKGKEYGELGKEFGKLGGRPRKGETKEEYKQRKEVENKEIETQSVDPEYEEKRQRAHNLARNYKKVDKKYDRGQSTVHTGWIQDNILTGQKCVYCGEDDWHKLGCDRIDNSKPHTPENVVCACADCNVERGDRYTIEEFKEIKTGQKTPLTVDVSVSEDVSISKSLSISEDKSISGVNNLSMEERENPREKEPSQEKTVKRDLMKLEDIYKLPEMEKRLEMQYQYVLKELPKLRNERWDFSESCYLPATIDWIASTEDFPVLTNCMLMWYDGGRSKLAEMVRGKDSKTTKDIMTYLVLSCIEYDTQGNVTQYQPVYAV